MSEMHKNLLIGVAIAAVLGGSLYVFLYGRISSSTPTPTNTATTTTTGGVTGTGSFTVEQVEPASVPPPSLKRPITITADLSEDAKVILRRLLEEQVVILKSEPTRIDVWLMYGTNRKIAGDFEGAIEAWEYVAQVAPKEMSATAHGNLGDLYMYFLKDYKKADTRFNQAIVLNPNVIEYYRALFYLYKDVYNDKAKAQAILTLGLANNPNNEDLLKYQAELNNS